MVGENSSELVYLVLITLATFYTVTVLIEEDGMFDLFAKWRLFVGITREVLVNTNGEDEWEYITDNHYRQSVYDDVRWVKGDRYWSKVFSCHRCLAPYIAPLIMLAYFIFPPAVVVLALAGAVTYLKE